jgi:beta-glucosidase
MKKIVFIALVLSGITIPNYTFGQKNKKKVSQPVVTKSIDARVDSLIQLMTIEEKVGQMIQIVAPTVKTGPVSTTSSSEEFLNQIRKDKVGSVLNAWGAQSTRKFQEVAVKETRLKIPLLFGLDVIHGYETTFPIPLAEAASWDLQAIYNSARTAAVEASSAGVHWTFAPMVDISRDPRWGRGAEGAGEDVYLGSLIAKARVEGFQGTLSKNNEIIACAKHYIGYGNTEAGKDYNTTDISERALRETYLPPFKACVDAGAGTFMSAFNELNGVPASGNKYTLDQILRKEWNYKGFVVSDWASITEMIAHGAAANEYEAAELAINATVDMEMVSNSYKNEIKNLLKDGKITMSQIDESVKRILRLKFQLGLFDNPYKYCDAAREKKFVGLAAHKETARDVARKSIVLLKNQNQLLPLSKEVKNIAVIGHLATLSKELNGTWAFPGSSLVPVTLLDGIKNKVSKTTKVTYSQGYDLYTTETTSLLAEAVNAAKTSDVLVVSVGEAEGWSGEAKSRASLDIPVNQDALLKELSKLGKPIVVVLTNGRALTIPWMDKNIPAIVESWFLGSETGTALADVLFGDYNPSGKLPVTFPVTIGQVPIYYNHKNTGRPDQGSGGYTSRYLDAPSAPLYPFGYGLSYTTFGYGPIQLSKESMKATDTLTVSIDLINTGKVEGKETVQLYIRDLAAHGVGRPVKELKGFTQVVLKAGEKKTVSFKITEKELSFYKLDMSYGSEPGDFKVFVGGNSRDVKEAQFTLVK